MEAGKDLGPRPELVGGGLIRSLGGWSAVLSLRQQGQTEAFVERIRSLVQETGTRILALALMGDQVHLAGINEPAGPPKRRLDNGYKRCT